MELPESRFKGITDISLYRIDRCSFYQCKKILLQKTLYNQALSIHSTVTLYQVPYNCHVCIQNIKETAVIKPPDIYGIVPIP